MKGLLKYLSPFAPDQSGAVSVLYELGGIIVICDAGGCTGNICGFDEPRWFTKKSALFSAGLRDMDAILGRDDRLVDKLKDAAEHLDARFIALIGTPVPAVIATDFRALRRMAEKRCGLPVLTVSCTGTRLYDQGAEEAYLELFRTFAKKEVTKDERTVGVIGATPLDVSHVNAAPIIRDTLNAQGYSRVYCYGMGGTGLDEVERAGSAAKNLVLSPAGIRAARYLQETFGTPYETAYPLLKAEQKEQLHGLAGKKVLVVHQQVAANEIRKEIPGKIVCGTWFMQHPEMKEPQDVTFEREEEFVSFVEHGAFDAIVGDKRLRRALRDFSGAYIEIPHFAVSGEYDDDIR
ncbi:MAG: nitrogenase component 1 [Clostridiales bacterium]|nr:nitrogenase component 1 [Clostridiales bacterium]